MKSSRVLVAHRKNWGLDDDKVANYARQMLVKRGLGSGFELSLLFVGPRKAKKLNVEYRHKDYIPQVLGFPMSRSADADGWVRLGDIVICNSKLKYEAKYYRKNIDKVLVEWLNHGLDNLLK